MLRSNLGMPFGIEQEVDGKYVGGHKAFPKETRTKVRLLSESLELEKLNLRIPYAHMTNIENADEHKIAALRVVLLGLIGVFWKKDSVNSPVVLTHFEKLSRFGLQKLN